MSRETVRVALFGLGYWGPNLLRNLLTVRQAQVVGVADVDPQALETLVQGPHGIATTRDHRELLARPDIDAVVISTPAAAHAAHRAG